MRAIGSRHSPPGSVYTIVTPSLSTATDPVIGATAIAGGWLPPPSSCLITRKASTSIAMAITSRTLQP
jgi:hypothetical protein